jgi:acetyl esterase/lipase
LLDDATRFAAVAGAADVRVTLEIWPHMIHAWPLWNAHLEPGRRALASAGAFIRDSLSGGSEAQTHAATTSRACVNRQDYRQKSVRRDRS